MSGTHTSLGLPQAAEGRAVKKLVFVLPLLFLALLMVSAPSQFLAAEGHSGWIAAKYVASGTETLSAVDFVTPGQDMRYVIQVYSGLEGGRPDGLLARQEGGTRDPGFYSIRLDSPILLQEEQAFVVIVRLKGTVKDGRYFAAAPGIEADSVYRTETPQGVFDSEDGLEYKPAPNEAPFTVRTEVSPEATTITSFTASPGIVAGTQMTFTFSATGTAVADAMTWVLKFGDGTPDATGAGPSPLAAVTSTHTYNIAGTYTADLYVVDTVDHTQAHASLTIVASIPVTASADNGCGPVALNVCFTVTNDPSQHATPPLTWLWIFGDGQKSSEENPCHAYIKKGTYTAILTVTDSKGATGTAPAIDINVSLPMVVTATADTLDGIDPTVVNFCSTVKEGIPPYTYEWDTGPTTTCPAATLFATDPCPQHAFNGVGTYYASVTVTDFCANDAPATSACLTVTVHESPWIRIVSPVSGTQEATVNIQTAIMDQPGVTISKVDFYYNKPVTPPALPVYYVIGSKTAPPWAIMWDASGLHGSYELTATALDSLGHSTRSAPVTITLDNPQLDGRVDAGGKEKSFRLKIYGNWFDRGCQVRINNVAVPQTVRKGTTMVVAKGGKALEALLPPGVPVIITLHNLVDGGISQGVTYVRYVR